MTCIVGVAHGGIVVLGADGLTNDGHVGTVNAPPKLFRLGEMLVGVAGDIRVAQLLAYVFEPPAHPPDEDAMRYLIGRFVPAARARLNTGGVKVDAGEGRANWCALIGYRGHLYGIYDDFQIEEAVVGFNAVGCGYQAALGSLHTTEYMVSLTPYSRVHRALSATARVDIHVGEPFAIEEARTL